jgi:putative transposase
MLPVISALLAFVTGLFRSRASLCLENLALRHQLAVYQQTAHRPRLHPTDRLFWAWLSRLWSGWQAVLAFVQPRTVIAWQQQRVRDHWRRVSQQAKPGRPAVAKEVRELIQAMWQANPTWGWGPTIIGTKTSAKLRPPARMPLGRWDHGAAAVRLSEWSPSR